MTATAETTRATGVHPAADAWPMLDEDELQALADSIADVGLLEPIVLTPDGRVLDGRNRLAACKIAGVELDFTTYDGDPVAYVLARNDSRRHMTKGQRAMAAWMTAASSEDANNLQATAIARAADLSHTMVGWARAIADDAPALVDEVLAGTLALKAAHDQVLAQRKDAATREDRWAELEAKAPDLVELVKEERLSLDEALFMANKREQERLEERRDATKLLQRVVDMAAVEDEALATWCSRIDATPDLIDRTRIAIAALTTLADTLEGETR